MDIYTRVKLIFSKPEKYFRKIQSEKGVSEAFKYYALLSLLGVLLIFISDLLFNQVEINFIQSMIPENFPLEYSQPNILESIFSYAINLVLSFVVVGILHLWIKAFRGKAKYGKTYQIYAYGSTPSLLLSWIPIVGGLAIIYDLVVLIIGTSLFHKISKLRSTMIYMIPLILLIIIIVILAIAFTIFFGTQQAVTSPGVLANL